MTRTTSLLASAGIGAMMIAIGATPAAAKTVHKKAHHAVAHHVDSEHAEIEALREQVQALTARLDTQATVQQQAQATAEQAQTQAAAAATQAQAAQTQAAAAQDAVPTEVKTQLAANKPKPQWFDSTQISGRMYFNFSNIDQKSNGVKSTGNGTGFNIKRFYLGVDHTFSPIFSADLTMDISNVVGNTANANFPGSPSNGSSTIPASCVTGTAACTVPGQAINNNVSLVGKGFYVKKAYLQAKLNPAFIIRLGSADMPWIPYVENQYGYRQIENTLIDRTNFGTSADWGVHVLGDLAGGLLSYQVSVIDGGGYRNVKVTNSVDVEGRVSAQYKGFYAAGGFYSGKRGNDTQGITIDLHTATRYDALIGYKTKLFNIGGEYFHAKNWNNVNTVGEDKSDGYSGFANVNFMPKFSLFGRYDYVKPNKDTNDNLKDRYYNVGVQWEPVKIVDLAIVYKHEKADNGIIATQNGSIGGVNPTGLLEGGYGTYSEIGLFGQLRF